MEGKPSFEIHSVVVGVIVSVLQGFPFQEFDREKDNRVFFLRAYTTCLFPLHRSATQLANLRDSGGDVPWEGWRRQSNECTCLF